MAATRLQTMQSLGKMFPTFDAKGASAVGHKQYRMFGGHQTANYAEPPDCKHLDIVTQSEATQLLEQDH